MKAWGRTRIEHAEGGLWNAAAMTPLFLGWRGLPKIPWQDYPSGQCVRYLNQPVSLPKAPPLAAHSKKYCVHPPAETLTDPEGVPGPGSPGGIRAPWVL